MSVKFVREKIGDLETEVVREGDTVIRGVRYLERAPVVGSIDPCCSISIRALVSGILFSSGM